MNKTFTPKPGDLMEKWYLVDANDQILGRLASRIAMVLRGKNSPKFTPHANMNHHVVVVNADKVRLTGRKWDEKMYYRHTNWPGGLKTTAAKVMRDTKPTEMLRIAVKGMLPHNRLGRAIMKNLRLVTGPDHPHSAQKPVAIDLMKQL